MDGEECPKRKCTQLLIVFMILSYYSVLPLGPAFNGEEQHGGVSTIRPDTSPSSVQAMWNYIGGGRRPGPCQISPDSSMDQDQGTVCSTVGLLALPYPDGVRTRRRVQYKV